MRESICSKHPKNEDKKRSLTSNDTPSFWLATNTFEILSAALTGTVLFSTTILLLVAVVAMVRADSSTYLMSAARPWDQLKYELTGTKSKSIAHPIRHKCYTAVSREISYTHTNLVILEWQTDALTLPSPQVFVGVFTDMNMRSASLIAVSTSVEKKRFLLRRLKTISSRPGCKTIIHTVLH